MPIFTKKFEPKPAPPRTMRCNGCPTAKEDLNEYKKVSIVLGNQEMTFIDGNWLLSTSGGGAEEMAHLKRKLKQVEEKNNLNEVKVEILLDLLSENISELNILKANDV